MFVHGIGSTEPKNICLSHTGGEWPCSDFCHSSLRVSCNHQWLWWTIHCSGVLSIKSSIYYVCMEKACDSKGCLCLCTIVSRDRKGRRARQRESRAARAGTDVWAEDHSRDLHRQRDEAAGDREQSGSRRRSRILCGEQEKSFIIFLWASKPHFSNSQTPRFLISYLQWTNWMQNEFNFSWAFSLKSPFFICLCSYPK